MKKAQTIFEHNGHKWVVIARDPARPNYLIDTNEYLIVKDSQAILCDPGGMEIFPAVFSAINEVFDAQRITALFASHQDPDIISSLALWLEFNPALKCYLSRIWSSFIPHFGGNESTFIRLPDEGTTFNLGSLELTAVPAHYLHSSGNFHLYDARAKILFSGDIGAALLPPGRDELYVKNFDEHIQHCEGFHKRWMGSNEAKIRWCEYVSKLEIEMMCPQHGAIFKGADVGRFINWFSELNVGITW